MKITSTQIAGAITNFMTSIGAIVVGVYCGIYMGRFEAYASCSEKGVVTYSKSLLIDGPATITCKVSQVRP